MMDAKIVDPSYKKYLDLFTVLNGVIYCLLGVFVYGWKFGFVWHDAGKPFFQEWPTEFNGYLNMIVTTYFVLGVFMITAGRDGCENHKSLLAFNMWGANLGHNVGMIWSFATMGYNAPYYWPYPNVPANISPIGDISALGLLFCIDLFLFKKVFGTFI